jgi:hypothetical protein
MYFEATFARAEAVERLSRAEESLSDCKEALQTGDQEILQVFCSTRQTDFVKSATLTLPPSR